MDLSERNTKLEEALTAVTEKPLVWKQQKPTEPGAYWLKGNVFLNSEHTSLVRVEVLGGALSVVSCDDADEHKAYLAEWGDDFYWAGPLASPPKATLIISTLEATDVGNNL